MGRTLILAELTAERRAARKGAPRHYLRCTCPAVPLFAVTTASSIVPCAVLSAPAAPQW